MMYFRAKLNSVRRPLLIFYLPSLIPLLLLLVGCAVSLIQIDSLLLAALLSQFFILFIYL